MLGRYGTVVTIRDEDWRKTDAERQAYVEQQFKSALEEAEAGHAEAAGAGEAGAAESGNVEGADTSKPEPAEPVNAYT